MPQALQIRRGLRAALPTIAALGEPLIATDTREMFIGTGTSVYKIGDIIFDAVPPPVVPEKVWVNTANNSIYRAANDGLSWVLIVGGSAGAITADFQVYGVSQGIYNDGNVIPAGTSLEDVIKNMLQRVIPPTYASPTLSLAGSGVLTVEAGTTVSPLLTPTFNQRDGGSALAYQLKKDGLEQLANPDGPYVLGDESITYQATQTYGQGPIKDDNQGNPYPTGQIQAGTATSNIVTYTGKRKMFYGLDNAVIRSLGFIMGPVNGTNFTFNIPAGTTRVTFAYPATLRDVSTIKYFELGNGEVKDTFTKTLVDIEGAAGFTAMSYKVYTYAPAVPFGDNATYTGVI